jgi:serine/threonine protein kinase/DNA-binding LacI/PurR family transcriptional regulator
MTDKSFGASTTDPLIGKRIGGYEIVELIGYGGMANVYRATQTNMRRDVALKILSASLTKDANFVARFRLEVELVGKLEHAHIVPVYEHGITPDGLTYLTMRHIRGGNVQDMVGKQGGLPFDKIAVIIGQVASALDYAHKQGVVHRDIKPGNILLDEQGDAYLADFGLARTVDAKKRESSAHKMTEPGSLTGTPIYLSPEQIKGETATERSDIYSLGVVLYEMLTGQTPFDGSSVFTIMQAHISEPPPSPRKLRPEVPAEVDAVIARALSKEPNQRYANASALANAFAGALAGRRTTWTRLPTLPDAPAKTSGVYQLLRQPRGLLGVGALAVLALLAVLVLPSLFNQPANNNNTTALRSTAAANQSGTAAPTAVAAIAASNRPRSGTIEDITLSSEDLEKALTKTNASNGFIGIVACTLETEYHASLIRSARQRAAELGFEVKVENANKEAFRQSTFINSFLAQGAVGIFLCALDEELITEAINAASAAGVPVAYAGDTLYGGLAISFTLTNEVMGRRVGEYAGELVNKELGGVANAIILDYPPVPVVVARADAMRDALLAAAPNVKILGNYQGGVTEDGYANTKKALAEHPEINLILSINDAGTFGAVRALREAGKDPNSVIIVSVDGETEARRLIEVGQYLRATLDSDPVGLAAHGIDAIVESVAAKNIPEQILLAGKMITKETLAKTPSN